MRTWSLRIFLSLAALTCLDSSARAQGLSEIPRGLNLTVLEERYEIEAERLDQVVDVLNEMRLEGADGPLSQGLTDYRVVPEWKFSIVGSGCTVSDVTVDVSITITLPRWPSAQHASEQDRRRWSEILLRITRHEYRHRDITVEVATRLLTELRAIEAGTCTAVRRAAEGALALAEADLTDRHAEFDALDRGQRRR